MKRRTSSRQSLARVLRAGLIIYLHGDLGAGKTAMTRAILHGADIKARSKADLRPRRTLPSHDPRSKLANLCILISTA